MQTPHFAPNPGVHGVVVLNRKDVRIVHDADLTRDPATHPLSHISPRVRGARILNGREVRSDELHAPHSTCRCTRC